MQIAQAFEDLIENNFCLETIDPCLFVKLDSCIEIFLIVTHNDVQILSSWFICDIVAKYFYYKIVF